MAEAAPAEQWVVYKTDGVILFGKLLSTQGATYAYVERIAGERVRRSHIYGAFPSELLAMRARNAIRDDPHNFILRSDCAALEGFSPL